jgi:hypothetical protein
MASERDAISLSRGLDEAAAIGGEVSEGKRTSSSTLAIARESCPLLPVADGSAGFRFRRRKV